VEAAVAVVTRDATVRKQVEEQLRRSASLHRTLTTNLPDTSVFLIDREEYVAVAEDDGTDRIAPFGDAPLAGCTLTELRERSPGDVPLAAVEHCRAALRGESRAFEIHESSGKTFELDAIPVRADDGTIECALVVARDVTDGRNAELRLRQRARQQEAVARLGQIALRDPDPQELANEVVATCARTLELEICCALELRDDGTAFDVVASVGLRPGCEDEPVPNTLATQAGWTTDAGAPLVIDDLPSETRFGDTTVLLDHGVVSGMMVPIEGRDRPFGVIGCHTGWTRRFDTDDVNFLTAVGNVLSTAIQRHRDEQSSRHAALHDPLTGLPNRTLALDRLQRALARRGRDGGLVATLMLDLDRFKVINDSLGHQAGDDLLLALAPRLSEVLRASDTIARLSGDEFLVICHAPAGVREVIAVAERLAAAVSRPFALDSGEHFMTASIGISIATGPRDTASSLLRDADAAMYRAKRRGPGRYELFDDAMRAQVLTRMQTENELHRAITGGELRVYYQPIIDLRSGRPLATEALVRWQHPERGTIPPAEFIAVAEETGLIGELGRWVLEEACAQGAAWQKGYDSDLQMFVNVSGRQIASPQFPREVRDIAARSGMRPGTLGLEVTESVLIEEAESPMAVLNKLRRYGLRLVLDDFGRGYSSLSYLKHLPIDGMKIDRSFTDGLTGDIKDVVIMRAVVDMAHALGMSVVAEGVESEMQADELRRLGCRNVQGFLFSRPLPAPGMTSFLDERLAKRNSSVTRG
jgi:diguanylate cyclase (GGDEF)-like protein